MKRIVPWVSSVCWLALGCDFPPAHQPDEPAPERAIEGETQVTVTPAAPEPAPPPADAGPPEPVEPVEAGVHETAEQTRGRLPKGKITPVLDAHRSEFTRCYSEVLAAEPGLTGRVVLLLVIAPDGSVPHAQIMPEGTTLENAQVHQCLIREAMTLGFERPVGGRVVTEYPLEFEPLPAEGAPSLPAKGVE